MIVDPRWYDCFMAALTGVSSANKGTMTFQRQSALHLADEAYAQLLAREAFLVTRKPKEVKKGQIWRFPANGPILIVEEVKGDTVFWRRGEGDELGGLNGHAPGILKMQDAYLIGQEPAVPVAEDNAAPAPEGEQGQSR